MHATIPRTQWQSHLSAFSDRHRGWLVQRRALDGGSGELPLQGVALTGDAVTVQLGEPPSVVRVMQDVTAIEEDVRADGAIEGLTIRGRDGALRIAFRVVIAPELVDGMVEPAPREWAVQVPSGVTRLDGNLTVPPRAQAVVCFAHGSGSGRHSTRNRFVARALQDAGIATLLLDLLTAAEERVDDETGAYRFDIDRLANRVTAACEWLAAEPSTMRLPLGLFGASTGAAAALIAATWQRGVRALVSRGGRPDLAGDALERVRCPVSLIVGGRDEPVLALNSKARTALRAPSELVVVPGATHLFPEPGALEQVARVATRWFVRHLVQSQRVTAPIPPPAPRP